MGFLVIAVENVDLMRAGTKIFQHDGEVQFIVAGAEKCSRDATASNSISLHYWESDVSRKSVNSMFICKCFSLMLIGGMGSVCRKLLVFLEKYCLDRKCGRARQGE